MVYMYLGTKQNQKYTIMHIYSSVTDAIHPFSVVSVVEDLTCDWLDTQAFQTY